jgi:hypothetical protein
MGHRESRLRLAKAFAEEATRLNEGPVPPWCRLSREEIERYARDAAQALRRLDVTAEEEEPGRRIARDSDPLIPGAG